MKFDIFLSICQTEVDGYTPNERQMFLNFFDQVRWADQLGYGTAWVAETHLSCQVQKQNSGAVIKQFKGEIGLNTDILQLAHKVFSQTKKIHIGSAIRNIICNGGPIAHAEAIRMFLTLNSMDASAERRLQIGYAAGRFPFSNSPYGFYPKSELEKIAWESVKGKYFQQASEIFLRLLSGEHISSKDLRKRYLKASDFRTEDEWKKALEVADKAGVVHSNQIELGNHWEFEKVGVIPFDAPMENLDLTIGSHDPEAQIEANEYLPVGVFNLSITPPEVIEATHQRMQKCFHPKGGPWRRSMMPRTVLLFLDRDSGRAQAMARRAWENYWKAMDGTLDPKKVESAVSNTIAGNPEEVAAMVRAKYHPEDRLMLWFDFNNHDNQRVKEAMQLFTEKVAPSLES